MQPCSSAARSKITPPSRRAEGKGGEMAPGNASPDGLGDVDWSSPRELDALIGRSRQCLCSTRAAGRGLEVRTTRMQCAPALRHPRRNAHRGPATATQRHQRCRGVPRAPTPRRAATARPGWARLAEQREASGSRGGVGRGRDATRTAGRRAGPQGAVRSAQHLPLLGPRVLAGGNNGWTTPCGPTAPGAAVQPGTAGTAAG